MCRGGEWYLEKRGSRKIFSGSRNLGSVYDKSRSLVFSWFVFTFLSLETFYQRVLGSDFLLGSRRLGESRILPFATPMCGQSSLLLCSRHFFNEDPGHCGPACVRVSKCMAIIAVSNPESHSHSSLVNVIAVSFNVTVTVKVFARRFSNFVFKVLITPELSHELSLTPSISSLRNKTFFSRRLLSTVGLIDLIKSGQR